MKKYFLEFPYNKQSLDIKTVKTSRQIGMVIKYVFREYRGVGWGVK